MRFTRRSIVACSRSLIIVAFGLRIPQSLSSHRLLEVAASRSRKFTMSARTQESQIRKISPLSPDEAKWTQLNKIEWTDQTGRERVWEAASRKTRGKTGIDAVAIAPILRHPSRPASTLVILQYRPPVKAFCVEFPAGLIDEDETPEEAAVRELREETGYEGKVLDCSPTIVADPGLTDANMQVCCGN